MTTPESNVVGGPLDGSVLPVPSAPMPNLFYWHDGNYCYLWVNGAKKWKLVENAKGRECIP